MHFHKYHRGIRISAYSIVTLTILVLRSRIRFYLHVFPTYSNFSIMFLRGSFLLRGTISNVMSHFSTSQSNYKVLRLHFFVTLVLSTSSHHLSTVFRGLRLRSFRLMDQFVFSQLASRRHVSILFNRILLLIDRFFRTNRRCFSFDKVTSFVTRLHGPVRGNIATKGLTGQR